MKRHHLKLSNDGVAILFFLEQKIYEALA